MNVYVYTHVPPETTAARSRYEHDERVVYESSQREQAKKQKGACMPRHAVPCLAHHAAHAVLQRHELAQPLFQQIREVEQAQSVPCGRSVKHDCAVVHALNLLQHFCKRHGLIYSWN
jgi:hypothetical protein